MLKRRVKTHTFAGVLYDVDVEQPFDGICDFPRSGKRPALRVSTDIDTLRGLTSLLHESLHASAWAKSEEVTERTANDIARLLRRLGFRRR